MATMLMRTRLNGILYVHFPRFNLEMWLGETQDNFWMLWRKWSPLLLFKFNLYWLEWRDCNYIPLPYLHEWPQCARGRPDLNNWSLVQCTAADSAGLMKCEDQLNLFLAVLQPHTGKRRFSCYGSIVYEDVHSSEVVLDPREGRHHIGLVTDVTFYGEQFTGRWLQRFGQFLEQSTPHYFRTRVKFVTDIRDECVS